MNEVICHGVPDGYVLQRGDIILTANYRAVTTLEGLENAVRTAQSENREALLLRVQRRGRPPQYVAVRLR